MSAPAWMKFFPNDYLGDTAHLTTWEHGAYLLLIIHAWKRGGEVHRSKAYAVARAVTPAERETVDRLLAEFFTAAGENFSHGRVKTELANAAELRAKRAEFGAKGGATRWAKGTQVDSKSYGTSHAEATKPGKQKHGASLPPSESPSDSESGVGVSSSLRSDSYENRAANDSQTGPVIVPTVLAAPREYRATGERKAATLADVDRDIRETERVVGEIAANIAPTPCAAATYPPAFEALWERWRELKRPNDSKAGAYAAAALRVNTGKATWEQLSAAVGHFVEHYRANPKESPNFYPMLSTFLGSGAKGIWPDWVSGIPSHITDAPDYRGRPSAQMRAYMGGGR